MNKFWTIASHTFLTKAKSKTFIITTAITLAMILLVGNIQSIINAFSDNGKDKVAVIDQSQSYYPMLKDSMAKNDDIELVPFKESIEKAKEAVKDDKYDALLELRTNEAKLPAATFYANNIASSSIQEHLQEKIQEIKTAIATNQAGLDQETVQKIYAPVEFDKVALDKSAKTEEELNQARGIVYIMLFILYMAVMLYGQIIATDVATEKSSRVMEIIISSVSPITHMFAKISGIAALGLSQIILIVLAGYAMVTMKKSELVGGVFEFFGIQHASVKIFIYAIVFFLLGFLLYATLAAMLGSLVSRVEEAGQMVMPMTLLIVAAFMIAMFGIGMPDSKFVTVCSFIPFFSPMVMFLRIGMLDVAFWQVAVSLVILIVTIVVMAIIGAKVYRGGVLMYGRSNAWKGIRKAIQLTKNE
ncbi:ABC transporter permease [Virgibacillus sp. 179-BFC.A HS]|uniref:ABC transporter permease n=1 Tax=Tigheibacillus jepli TaxID=3035914 RepID=A0ABU5CK03_9BACI|nr:ABC transporter permease [Virgibacillus sp. 179-BFC.A HS]MDY0406256.1 ABC transporter permease [Virgibacillus sp. 179-BFC.A HS]